MPTIATRTGSYRKLQKHDGMASTTPLYAVEEYNSGATYKRATQGFKKRKWTNDKVLNGSAVINVGDTWKSGKKVVGSMLYVIHVYSTYEEMRAAPITMLNPQ
ncbi:hypothetical protein Tco_0584940 [Tanacetum coccineum]